MGGEDLDNRIVDLCIQDFKRKSRGKFYLVGAPPTPRGAPQIEVTSANHASRLCTRVLSWPEQSQTIVQQWFDSLADLVSPMSPLTLCKALVQQWFDTLADPVSPMSPLGSCKVLFARVV